MAFSYNRNVSPSRHKQLLKLASFILNTIYHQQRRKEHYVIGPAIKWARLEGPRGGVLEEGVVSPPHQWSGSAVSSPSGPAGRAERDPKAVA